jgi:hypothetical protein
MPLPQTTRGCGQAVNHDALVVAGARGYVGYWQLLLT